MAVCRGLDFWLEAATASLRHRCCAGLTAARAVLRGLAASGVIIATAMASKTGGDRCGGWNIRGSRWNVAWIKRLEGFKGDH